MPRTTTVDRRGRPSRSTCTVDRCGSPPQFTKMHADTAASLAVSLVRGLQQVVVCQLCTWVYIYNSYTHTLSIYIGFGTKMLEPTRPLSTSTEEFAIERYSEIMSGSNHKCKCLKVIFVWAEYYFLIPFLSLVNVRNKSRFDPSALRLSIPRTKFKEFCTALVSLIVFRESSLEIK